MKHIPFRPVDVLRRLEETYSGLAESHDGVFEAFVGLGCEDGRVGDADALEKIVRDILGPQPFDTPGQDLRLKISAKTHKPVIIEIASSSGKLAVPESLAPLIAEMGGEISVLPGGSRTTVRVTVPLPEAEIEVVQADVPVQEELNSLAGVRILIADDSPTNRLVLEEMLADTQAELTSVSDGLEALNSWRAGRFDLLLLDISMPVMDGVTAIREIRAAEQEKGLAATPAIAVTANALVNQVADYLEAGFDTHLAKPFRRKDLMHAIMTLRI